MGEFVKKVLVISPHPDDEVLGCGGTLLKLKKKYNYELNWLIITKISKKYWSNKKVLSRKKEISDIKRKIGFQNLIELKFESGSLNNNNLSKLIKKLGTGVKKIKPEIVFVPYINDCHSDHFFTTYAFNSISKTFRYSFLEKILVYETLSETNFNRFNKNKFTPNVFVDITHFINEKIKLMKTYNNELGKHPFPRSEKSIKSLSILRGSQSNFKFAESFELIFDKQNI